MPRGAAALLVMASCVAACSGDAGGAADRRATFSPCEGDYECATVEVPIDYANPDGPKIGIAILRAPAKDPAARLGAVVVNPGGPGLAYVERLATQYSVLSATFAEATTRFDVVTFDWRGVGRSVSIACADDALFDRIRSTDLTLQTAGSLEAVTALRTSLLTGCLAKADPKLLGAMNTENAARDLDRIREALGEEKLNYLAFSYGTWLGATYATLFPNRVRAFALDSATVLANDLDSDIREQAASYDLGIARFLAANPPAVAARLDALLAKVKAGNLPAGARSLSIVDLQFAIADGLRDGSFLELAADLASAEAGDATKLLERADSVTGRDATGHYDSSILGLLAIACVDQPLGAAAKLDAFQAFTNATRAAHPRGTSPAMLPWALCTDWPYRRAAPRLAINAAASPKALVIAGRYDPITGYEQGAELVRLLGNGSALLTYDGDGHAAALHSACIRDQITAFLIDPTRPPSVTTCPAE